MTSFPPPSNEQSVRLKGVFISRTEASCLIRRLTSCLTRTRFRETCFPGFSCALQINLFLEIRDRRKALSWLARLSRRLATMRDLLEFRSFVEAEQFEGGLWPESWVNCGISARGLLKLSQCPSEFHDRAFQEGMGARSTLFGDPLEPSTMGHVSTWVVGGLRAPDIVIIVGASDQRLLASALIDLTVGLPDSLRILH